MDKGNYSMFDTVRPIVTPGGPPPANAASPMMYPGFPPHMIPPHLAPDRGGVVRLSKNNYKIFNIFLVFK